METQRIPQLLLVAGTGRNTGKTTFICNLIRKFNTEHQVVALKITPHFHRNVQSGEVIINNEELYIARETDSTTTKDSSKMLQSGAFQSYFIMAKDEQLGLVMREIEKLLPPHSLIVCESGGLRNLVIPGLFFMMEKEGEETSKPGAASLKLLADRIITFDGQTINFDPESVEISDNRWTLKQSTNDLF